MDAEKIKRVVDLTKKKETMEMAARDIREETTRAYFGGLISVCVPPEFLPRIAEMCEAEVYAIDQELENI